MIATVNLPDVGKYGIGVPRERWKWMRCTKCGVVVLRHPQARRCLSCKGELVDTHEHGQGGQ